MLTFAQGELFFKAVNDTIKTNEEQILAAVPSGFSKYLNISAILPPVPFESSETTQFYSQPSFTQIVSASSTNVAFPTAIYFINIFNLMILILI
jgi:hypothetical protein